MDSHRPRWPYRQVKNSADLGLMCYRFTWIYTPSHVSTASHGGLVELSFFCLAVTVPAILI